MVGNTAPERRVIFDELADEASHPLDYLHSRISDLDDRLMGVSRGKSPATEGKNQVVETLPDKLQQLRIFIYLVEKASNRVNDILDRLEV